MRDEGQEVRDEGREMRDEGQEVRDEGKKRCHFVRILTHLIPNLNNGGVARC